MAWNTWWSLLRDPVSGGGQPFTPASLPGYVDSPSSFAALRSAGKLWQDTAKTVPAAADGDPVRVAACGSKDYAASTDATRPILYDEGAGKWSLSFDGVDDTLEAAWTGTVQLTLAAAALLTGAGFYPVVLLVGEVFREVRFLGGSRRIQSLTNAGTGDGTGDITAPTALPLDTWIRCVATHGASAELYVDAVEVDSDVDSTVNPANKIQIGARGDTLFLPGRVAGTIVAGQKSSAADVARIDAYFATLTP